MRIRRKGTMITMTLAFLLAIMLFLIPIQGNAKTVTIDKIENFNVKLLHKQIYKMPAKVIALMSNKKTSMMYVKWDKNINTSVLGKSVAYGTVKGYRKKVVFTAFVEPAVVAVENISATVLHNKEYTLPDTVLVTLSTGTSYSSSVMWNTNSVDTSKLGTIKLYGNVKKFSGVVTLILQVEPAVETVEELNLEAEHNKSFGLPEKLKAVLSDGSTSLVAVDWGNSHVDTTTIGAISFQGTVKGYDKKVNATINVKPVILLIHEQKQTVRHGDAYQLPQTIMADYSDNTSKLVPVTWTGPAMNTNVDGVKEYIGQVSGYSRPVVLYLEVKPIVLIPVETNINVKRFSSFTPPQAVNVTLTNGTVKQLPVIWDVATAAIDTSKDGKTLIGGMVEYDGISYKVSCSACIDETAPVVAAFEVLTPTVQQKGSLQMRATVTDAVAGVDSVKAYYWVEAQRYEKEYVLKYDGGGDSWSRNDTLDGLEIKGIRRLVKIKVTDKNGNWIEYDRNQLPIGPNYDFTIGDMTGDIETPILKSIELKSGTYLPGEYIRVKAEVTDEKSGVGKITVILVNIESNNGICIDLEYSGTGDLWQGHWQALGIEDAGIWRISQVDCYDKDGNFTNYLYYNCGLLAGKTFVINNGRSDTKPPSVESVEVTPTNVTAGKAVSIKIKATDDSSGVKNIMLFYKDPSGAWTQWIQMSYNTSLGLWEATFTPKQSDLKGQWTLSGIDITDAAGNSNNYVRNMIPGADKADFTLN